MIIGLFSDVMKCVDSALCSTLSIANMSIRVIFAFVWECVSAHGVIFLSTNPNAQMCRCD